MSEKISMQTSKLFTLRFLAKHPTTAPIIMKYLGLNWYYRAKRHSSELSENICCSDKASDCLQLAVELDNVPVQSLLLKSFTEDFKRFIEAKRSSECDMKPQDCYDAVSEYLTDRPYNTMLSGNERQFIKTLLVIYAIKKYTFMSLPYYSPTDWQDTMIYLRHYNKRLFNVDTSLREQGEEVLMTYLARYVYDRLDLKQLEKLEELLDNFFDLEKFTEHSGKLFEFISMRMGEEIQEKFIHQSKPRLIDVDELDFDNLYRYPEWIEFTPAAHKEIIRLILSDELSDEQIDYYLGTSERAEYYVELYPAVKHVLQTTNKFHTFYTAGDVLNIIWKNLPEDDEKLQQWFRREVYDIFWPRIGDVWPIIHYDALNLQEDNKEIFEDALGWIMCLDDIGIMNKELEDYLKSDINTNLDVIKVQHFVLTHRDDDIEKRFKAASNELSYKALWRCFRYPKTAKEADFILNQAKKSGAWTLCEVLEMMLLTGNSRGVGSHIINNLAEDFKLWYKNMRTGDNPIDNMLSMFTAACEGATEEDELDPICLLRQKIESEAKKFIEVVTDDYNDIKQYVAIASDLANRRVADYRNQCEDLQKNLRKHAEEITKTIAPPNLMNINCFKSEAKNDYSVCI